MKKNTLIAIILMCVGLTPVVAFSQSTNTSPFTCNKNGQVTASAGSTTALGGPYVPVADYAVELNTGLLAYKECVLREIVSAQRKAGLATVDNQVLTRFNSGEGGNPTFGGFPSRERGKEKVQLADKTYLRYLQNDSLSGFTDSLEGSVKQGIARGYSAVRDPRKEFACEYADDGGNLGASTAGIPVGDFWTAYDALNNDPACTFFRATSVGFYAIENQNEFEQYKDDERLDWGDGTYDLAHYDENGFRITDTQGEIVLQQGIQSIQSAYVQAQSADDLGEMVDGLYLGVTNQVLTAGNVGTTGTGGVTTGGSAGGLSAITQALSGALSYMGQVVNGQTGQYVDATANATLGILQGALATERQYNAAVTSNANVFTQTNAALRAKETQCFTQIVEAVCQPGTLSGTTCTGVSGATLTTASSTVFSQKVIDTNVRPLANATVANLNTSNQIITRLQQIIAGLTASPTQAAQTAALAALAALNPHNSSDVNAATAGQQQTTTLMTSLLSNTNTAWTEGTTPNVGWCNVSNEATKDAWSSCWGGTQSACPTP